ncbi:hypothetical protein ABIB73_003280 [Bradyrhizobium sp. F1.4.3]
MQDPTSQFTLTFEQQDTIAHLDRLFGSYYIHRAFSTLSLRRAVRSANVPDVLRLYQSRSFLEACLFGGPR